MAKDHLQLHGQNSCNSKEPCSCNSSCCLQCGLELKKIITKPNESHEEEHKTIQRLFNSISSVDGDILVGVLSGDDLVLPAAHVVPHVIDLDSRPIGSIFDFYKIAFFSKNQTNKRRDKNKRILS